MYYSKNQIQPTAMLLHGHLVPPTQTFTSEVPSSPSLNSWFQHRSVHVTPSPTVPTLKQKPLGQQKTIHLHSCRTVQSSDKLMNKVKTGKANNQQQCNSSTAYWYAFSEHSHFSSQIQTRGNTKQVGSKAALVPVPQLPLYYKQGLGSSVPPVMFISNN